MKSFWKKDNFWVTTEWKTNLCFRCISTSIWVLAALKQSRTIACGFTFANYSHCMHNSVYKTKLDWNIFFQKKFQSIPFKIHDLKKYLRLILPATYIINCHFIIGLLGMLLNLFGWSKQGKNLNNLQMIWILQLTVELILTFMVYISVKQNCNDLLDL